MREKIEINLLNTSEKYYLEPGLALQEIAESIGIVLPYPVLGAMVNNRLRDLRFRAFLPVTVEFIDITHPAGWRMYVRSLFFVLQKAVRDQLPDCRLRVEHSVSNGYYCEIEGLDGPIEYPLIFELHDRIRSLIARDIPFESNSMLTEEAIERFTRQNDPDKVRFLRSRPRLYTTLYGLDGIWDYYFEGLIPSTGYIKAYDLVKYYHGMLLVVPQRLHPDQLEELVVQDKMFDIFREFKEWGRILGISDAATINTRIAEHGQREIIQVSEALHEKKLAQIADQISQRPDPVRVVLVAGPSSSGKTTFAKRLSVQLSVAEMLPFTLSLDNYFVNREDTPRDEKGQYNFEAFEALDIEQFNDDLLAMLQGREVLLPKFDFESGKRFYDDTRLQLPPNGVLVIEGIHALNPRLTHRLPREAVFRIYISALTSISLDGRTRIASSDNRLLRRIVRDHKYRGYSALNTIKMWGSVRRGEDCNIFPYQEEADVMFNSALPYEFCVLKHLAEPVLSEVPDYAPEYSEAKRLLKFLQVFTPITSEGIPPTSILREFLGGSSFSYR